MATMQPAGPLPELARIRAVCRSRTAGIRWTCSHCIPTLWYLWVLKEAAADSLTIPRMKKKNLCCFQKLAKFHESSDRMNFFCGYSYKTSGSIVDGIDPSKIRNNLKNERKVRCLKMSVWEEMQCRSIQHDQLSDFFAQCEIIAPFSNVSIIPSVHICVTWYSFRRFLRNFRV